MSMKRVASDTELKLLGLDVDEEDDSNAELKLNIPFMLNLMKD
jgi:hypothetical protein